MKKIKKYLFCQELKKEICQICEIARTSNLKNTQNISWLTSIIWFSWWNVYCRNYLKSYEI